MWGRIPIWKLTLSHITLLYAFGIMIYFLVPHEPFYLPILTIICLFSVISCKYSNLKFLPSKPIFYHYNVLLLIALFSATVAFFHTAWLENKQSPFITEEQELQGMVVQSEDGIRYSRIILRVKDNASYRDWRIRLQENHAPLAGSLIAVYAKPLRSKNPIFDRYNFFYRIHGFAIALSDYQSLGQTDTPSRSILLARKRLQISRKIDSGQAEYDGIARALLVGMKAKIPSDILQELRHVGLGHILAISGLHFGIFAFGVFGLVRMILASIPSLALKYPIKKIAACFAVVAGFFYLLLSGAPISAERAFIMLCLICLAILHDEKAWSLNLLAAAALILLTFSPHILLEVGFQMSFGVVLGLIVFFEFLQRKTNYHRIAKPYRYVLNIILTSLIASLVVAPFTLYHFGYISSYSLLANLPAIPILGFWVMPWGALVLFLMPFELHHIPLAMMNLGIGAIIEIAHFVNGLKGSHFYYFRPAPIILWLWLLAGLLLTVFKNFRVTVGAISLICAGVGLYILSPPPSVILYGWDYGFRASESKDYIFTDKFPRGNLRKALLAYMQSGKISYLDAPEYHSANNPTAISHYHCDSLNCYLTFKNQIIAIAHRPEGAILACQNPKIDIVASLHVMPSPCGQEVSFISGAQIRSAGAIMIFPKHILLPALRRIYPKRNRIWYRSGK